jgi:hypothetical protein
MIVCSSALLRRFSSRLCLILPSPSQSPKKTVWGHFVDFWTGRYLYRESRRLAPFLFSKEEPEVACEAEEASASVEDAAEQAAELVASLPVPSAPELASDEFELIHSPAAEVDGGSVLDGVESPPGGASTKMSVCKLRRPEAMVGSIS